jgi:hypothetical protein
MVEPDVDMVRSSFFQKPLTGLADGFGREEWPYRGAARRRFTPEVQWVPGSRARDRMHGIERLSAEYPDVFRVDASVRTRAP